MPDDVTDQADDFEPLAEPEPEDPADDIERPDGTTPRDDHEAAAQAEADDQEQPEEEHDNPHGIRATYSPEDNKLRLCAATNTSSAFVLYSIVSRSFFNRPS
jgi:hypothetical protein